MPVASETVTVTASFAGAEGSPLMTPRLASRSKPLGRPDAAHL